MSRVTDPRAEAGAADRLPPRVALLRNDAVITVAVAIAAALLCLGRLPAGVPGVLWAEDGRNFLEDRLRLGPWNAVFDVYEGYVHVVPRLLTDVAVSAFPIDRFAETAALLASLTFGVIAGLVYVCSRDLIRSRAFRVLLAMITVLAPVLPLEILGNFANVHWGFLWLAPWLLLYRPRTWIGASALGIVALVGGLTEIQMLLFLPLAIVHVKWPKAWLVAVATAIGIAVQIVATVTSPRTPNVEIKPGPLDIAVGYVELPILGAFEGHSARIQSALLEGGFGVAIINALVAIVVIGFALTPVFTATGLNRFVPVILVGASLIAWGAALWLNPGPTWQYADLDSETLQGFRITRYVAVPSMLLLGAVVVAAAQAFDRGGRARFVAGLAIGIVAMGFIGSYHLDAIRRDGGPQWSTSIEQARQACEGGLVPNPIEIAPPTWTVDVTCDDIEKHR